MITDTLSKSNIKNMLTTDIVNVKFKKADGSERLMKCTLLEGWVKEYEKKTEKTRPVSEDTLSVWDVEKDGWRSFRYDSIIEIYK
jgi:hypothetical protein